MGGGSSDAAFTLRMLSDLYGLGLSDEKLAGYAARLGSDCAFFIYNQPMIGEGRGEVLTPFPVENISFGPSGKEDGAPAGKLPYRLEVIVPEGVAVSTADAYRGIIPAVPEESLRTALSKPVTEWKDCLKNDFEKTVFAKWPELQAVKDSLYRSGAVYAAMSGSGSALFAIYRED